MNNRLTKSMAHLPLWQVDAIAASVVIMGAGLWYFAGFSPLVEARAARQAMEAELVEEKEVLQQKATLVKANEVQVEKSREQNKASEVQLKPADYVNQQVQELTQMAGKAGLTIDEIRPQAAVPQDRFAAVPIKVVGNGAYTAVTGFLGRLRSDFHDTGVTGFSLRGIPDKPDEPLKIELSLVWYAAPLPARTEKKKP